MINLGARNTRMDKKQSILAHIFLPEDLYPHRDVSCNKEGDQRYLCGLQWCHWR
jgi:hypothetical protein